MPVTRAATDDDLLRCLATSDHIYSSDWLQSPFDPLGPERLQSAGPASLAVMPSDFSDVFDIDLAAVPELGSGHLSPGVLDQAGASAPTQLQQAMCSPFASANIMEDGPAHSSATSDNTSKQGPAETPGSAYKTKRRSQSAPASWQRKLEINREAQRRFRQKRKVSHGSCCLGCWTADSYPKTRDAPAESFQECSS